MYNGGVIHPEPQNTESRTILPQKGFGAVWTLLVCRGCPRGFARGQPLQNKQDLYTPSPDTSVGSMYILGRISRAGGLTFIEGQICLNSGGNPLVFMK